MCLQALLVLPFVAKVLTSAFAPLSHARWARGQS